MPAWVLNSGAICWAERKHAGFEESWVGPLYRSRLAFQYQPQLHAATVPPISTNSPVSFQNLIRACSEVVFGVL